MRHVTLPLAVSASVAAGAAQRCPDLADKTVQVYGTFTATLAIEGRVVLPNGTATSWQAIASVSAPGFTLVPQSVTEIRINTTAFTSGVPAAVLSGNDPNG